MWRRRHIHMSERAWMTWTSIQLPTAIPATVLRFLLVARRLQQATSDKQQAASNKRQATSDRQQATSNKRQATSDKQQATSKNPGTVAGLAVGNWII